MATSRANQLCAFVGSAILCSAAGANPGLATRDLNPILQSIYIPAYSSPFEKQHWQFSHSFYLTNTFSYQTADNEELIIDVENYRYVAEIAYRSANWVFQAGLPLTINRSGFFDSSIEDWHDFLGLSQGNRTNFATNQINIHYQLNGETRYLQNTTSNALGDLALHAGFYPDDSNTGFFFGLELPTGSAADFSGNETVDLAVWLTHEHRFNPSWGGYGLLGISFPGDGKILTDLLTREILVAQYGINYRYSDDISAILQLDFHSATVKHSELRAFSESLQAQIGLRFNRLLDNYYAELYLAEDILVGSAPDFSLGFRLTNR